MTGTSHMAGIAGGMAGIAGGMAGIASGMAGYSRRLNVRMAGLGAS